MNASRYYAWVVMDIEDWGGRPGSIQSRMQDALRGIIARAKSASSIAEVEVRRTSRGDGVILGIPTEVAKETITGGFLRNLNRELRLYDDECPPDEVMRLRVSLHAGDAQDGGDEWAGNSVVVACRLVDSEILHRVLKAASSAVLAIIVSDVWYDAVLRERWADPTGYDQLVPDVKDYDGGAWIKVPGFSHPPGLLPSDAPRRHQGQHWQGFPAERPDRISGGASTAIYGNVYGDTVTGDKYGDSFYGNGGKTVHDRDTADPGQGHRR
ncbi:MAG: hypothetical protein QOJ20_1139 [Mycobacterium sp.]|nr:hypothetical protein [Mycobacterium sp.]